MIYASIADRAPVNVDAGRPVLVVIGPSGSGKSTLVRALVRRGEIVVHPTWTTRPRRPGEAVSCIEHHFVSDTAFRALASTGFFWETATAFGLPYRYGLPPVRPSRDGRIDTVMMRSATVPQLLRHVPAILVYHVEAGRDDERRRLVARGRPPLETERRLVDNRREASAGRALADRVFVNDGSVDELVTTVSAALRADFSRRAAMTPRVAR